MGKDRRIVTIKLPQVASSIVVAELALPVQSKLCNYTCTSDGLIATKNCVGHS